jgi:predicted nucleic acid-binding protein
LIATGWLGNGPPAPKPWRGKRLRLTSKRAFDACRFACERGVVLVGAEPIYHPQQHFFAAAPELIAPFVFPIEVRHIVQRLERRGVLPTAAVDVNLVRLEGDIAFAEPPNLNAILALARRLGLGVYDACYLHLALEERAPLATRDVALLTAAQQTGAESIDLR